MGGSGSGRRKLKKTSDPDDIPDLGDTEADVGAFLVCVTRKLVRGAVDPRTGDTLIAAAKAKLQELRQVKEFTKIEELRRMLAEVQAALRGAAEYETQVRTHRVNPPPAMYAAKRQPGTD